MWGVPILSVIVAYHFHHGSARMADTILAAFVNNMAHGLPIHRSPSHAQGVRRMGLGGGIHCFFILEHFFWVLVL